MELHTEQREGVHVKGVKSRSIASLDGARAVAISLVLLSHLAFSDTLPHSDMLMKLDVGNYGVRIFFVISGFLITTLLLNEHRKTGRVSLKQFYVRRFFRIFPAYYFFLAVTALLGVFGFVSVKLSQLPIVAAYLTNYANIDWLWGHSWSLSVEEQFYLLWPIALVAFGVRLGLRGIIAVLVICPIIRLAATNGLLHSNPVESFECVADALATGCLLAVCRERLFSNRIYSALVNSPLLVPFCLGVLVVTRVTVHDTLAWELLKIPTYNVLIMLVLDRYMRHPESWVGRVLNARPLVFVGVLSYSLYLWQQVWIFNFQGWQLVGIAGCALASYYLIERPVLRLRERMKGRVVSGANVVRQ
jgi:peptidoglycan/LPS O-acetylase OafA/YrhL